MQQPTRLNKISYKNCDATVSNSLGDFESK